MISFKAALSKAWMTLTAEEELRAMTDERRTDET